MGGDIGLLHPRNAHQYDFATLSNDSARIENSLLMSRALHNQRNLITHRRVIERDAR